MSNVRTLNLRSDTVSTPTAGMRRAMYEAEVGDDYYRADPTVAALEAKSAAILGKEAALFVISGTMGNLVGLLTLAQPGQSIIVGDGAHIYVNEAGGLAALAGLVPRVVPLQGGAPLPQDVRAAIWRTPVLQAPTTVLCLENTNNAAGGRVVSASQIDDLCRTAQAEGLKVHLDGARLFNAAVALGVVAARLVDAVDSVTFCLTKGLGCPMGAVLAGTRAFIEEARHRRQMLGGGLRQAGIAAAAGLYALDHMIDRLAEDHANARRFALLLADAGLPIDPADVDSNMVFLDVPEDLMSAEAFVAELGSVGIVINPPKGHRVRFVTHHDIGAEDVAEAGRRIANILRARIASRAKPT